MKNSPLKSQRQGAVAPLMALLLIPLLAMVAFAVDVGWMVLAQSELQAAADAAALAGAQQLLGQQVYNPSAQMYNLTNGFAQYYLPGQTPQQQSAILSAAKTSSSQTAKNYASYNAAGKVQSLVLNDADIEFGYADNQNPPNYTPLPTYTGYPNTVTVTLRLDNQANGPLALFFGPILGMNTINLTATARSSIFGGNIDSFRTSSAFNSRILPMTYDVNHWNYFLQNGQSIDGVVDLDANGTPQLDIYPSIKFTGNFGLLSLDQGNDGASTIRGWIDNGVPASDLKNEFNANLLPLSAHDPTKWDWKGNPGLKTSDIHALANHIGDTYLLPLYKPLDPGNPDPSTYAAGTGNGSHYYYNIVQFVGIKITYVDNKSVVVQPAAMIDPNAVFNKVAPASPPTQSSPLVTTFASPKLTR
jgi:Flp pilus assembly protein TadG